MSKIHTFYNLITKDSDKLGYVIAEKISRMKCSRLLSDETYLSLQYRLRFGKKINWKNPETYNEKLQWLKLYERKPVYSQMVDKYAVRKLVSETIGEQYLIPLLGKWDQAEDIDFANLPEQFVLKCNHDSKSICICKSKKNFDCELVRKKLAKSIHNNFFFYGREWPYKNVAPCIIAEKYMEDEQTGELRDYKVYCFDGEPRLVMVNSERGENTKADYFTVDREWVDLRWGYPNANPHPDLPARFDDMVTLAKKLAMNMPHVRVDFYEVNGMIYFGELTFFDGSGFSKFDTPEWDKKLGDWISI